MWDLEIRAVNNITLLFALICLQIRNKVYVYVVFSCDTGHSSYTKHSAIKVTGKSMVDITCISQLNNSNPWRLAAILLNFLVPLQSF